MCAEAQGLGFRASDKCHADAFAASALVDNHSLEFDCLITTIEHNAKPHCVPSDTGNENVGARHRQGFRGNRTTIFAGIQPRRDRIRLGQQTGHIRLRRMFNADGYRIHLRHSRSYRSL